jgi:DNA (cytosine-5)-methyltransferase 1
MSGGESHSEPADLIRQNHALSVGEALALGELHSFDPAQSKARGGYAVLDMFSGCGGLSTGFELVGRAIESSFHLAGGVDIDEIALETYAKNLKAPTQRLDLSTFTDRDSIRAHFDYIDRTSGLILIGGPPCQGFSAHRKREVGPEDGRNSLVAAYAEFAAALDPDFVVLENVPELLSKRRWHRFRLFRSILTDAGYIVRAQIHNLASFGVPQERFRALVLASKQGFRMPTPLLAPHSYRSVRDAIGWLPRVNAGERINDDDMHLSAGHKDSTLAVIRQIPKDGGNRPKGVGPPCLSRVDGFRDVYGRLAWDRTANTITAYARNPASGRFVHPEQDRGLTVREAALLQSFPRCFTFAGSFDAKFSQIGNAVPPAFAAYLAGHILAELIGEAPSSDELERDMANDVAAPTINSFSSSLAGRKALCRN